MTLHVLLQVAGYTLPYDEVAEVRERLMEIAPNLLQYDDLQPANFFALAEKLMKVCDCRISSFVFSLQQSAGIVR